MEEIRDHLRYEPDTGKFYWIKSRQRIRIGDEAGSLFGGYIHIRYRGKRYRAHRLAFLFMDGELPDSTLDVDHINGDPSDNRWCNLRLATRSQNLRNQRAKGSIKLKGVSLIRKSNRFTAQIGLDGKKKHIGCFSTAEEAHAAYRSVAIELHGEFFRP